MALQSSGQITLAEVRNEYYGNSGTTQFAMSSLYNKGNAPSSGEIELATDFYGTSNNISHSTTITMGTQELKAGIRNNGFISSSGRTVGTNNDNANGTTATIGSIANNNISGGGIVEAVYDTSGTTLTPTLKFEMSTAATNWTSITIGSNTYNRTSMSTGDNQLFTISLGGQHAAGIFSSSGTVSFSINS